MQLGLHCPYCLLSHTPHPQIMDYSMLLGIHYPKRAAAADPSVAPTGTGGGFERSSATMHDPDGTIRNFAEMDDEKRFKGLFPQLAERIAKLKIKEQAK